MVCKSVIQMLSNVICDDGIGYATNVAHWERVMLWDKLYQLSSHVYEYLRSLDKITLTSLLLDEDYSDFNMLLPDDIKILCFLVFMFTMHAYHVG